MSDGDGRDSLKFVSERENHQSKKRKKNKSGPDEFAQAIARIAAAQVCEVLGFQGFHQSALDTLADVGVRYIREIGRTACSYANLANRSECNVLDVIQGLEDLGSGQGFSCASDVNHALSESGVVKDIIRYVGRSDETPFAYLTPVFPVVKERVLNPSFVHLGESPPDEHVPGWLPKFPDADAYLNLSSRSVKETETEPVNKIQPVDEPRRKSVNFQQNLICNGFEAGVIGQGDASKTQRAEENNPFLAPPLQYGEKEVILPVLPDKFLGGVSDSYRKNNEAALVNNVITVEPSVTTSGPCEPEDRRKILLNGRPGIKIKFGNDKKSLESAEKVSGWFGDDDNNDGNEMTKRRADKILWEDTGFQPEV
ncbi:transcription initiation factor TFIID subunit 8 [Phtheirospermum japonicum]|uniref:Transcription initiation factor TFIID subunit 8 n=1 Tax=Phtheirospermum japonicum TaxID=374723 RepID=A0A830CNZ9_9LAMI|nr:transcription initiation factor TFIID subunit 8 [Phtheirospermum japonicum]